MVHPTKLGLKTFKKIKHVDYDQDNPSNEIFICNKLARNCHCCMGPLIAKDNVHVRIVEDLNVHIIISMIQPFSIFTSTSFISFPP
jgi:hypothetical protein